jgi:hypothetical protein
MFIWDDGESVTVTGSVDHAVLDDYLEAKEAGEDLSRFAPHLGVVGEPVPAPAEESKQPVDGLTATEVEADAQAAASTPPGDYYDPGKHSVAEVNEYLSTASDEEQQRVLDAEAAGKARPTLVGKSEET